MTHDERLDRIESLLAALVERQQVKDFYEIEEFARLVGRDRFTVREWARHCRIHADKKLSGRGAHAPVGSSVTTMRLISEGRAVALQSERLETLYHIGRSKKEGGSHAYRLSNAKQQILVLVQNGNQQGPLTHCGEAPVAVIAPTGSGKGRDFVIPNILHHKGSVIVVDPKEELYAVAAAPSP